MSSAARLFTMLAMNLADPNTIAKHLAKSAGDSYDQDADYDAYDVEEMAKHLSEEVLCEVIFDLADIGFDDSTPPEGSSSSPVH